MYFNSLQMGFAGIAVGAAMVSKHLLYIYLHSMMYEWLWMNENDVCELQKYINMKALFAVVDST